PGGTTYTGVLYWVVPTTAPCGCSRTCDRRLRTRAAELAATRECLASGEFRHPLGENGWPTSVRESIQVAPQNSGVRPAVVVIDSWCRPAGIDTGAAISP